MLTRSFFSGAVIIMWSVPAFAQQPPTGIEAVASCNIQTGQILVTLGQTQQQVITLQAQLAAAEKRISELQDAKTSPDKTPPPEK